MLYRYVYYYWHIIIIINSIILLLSHQHEAFRQWYIKLLFYGNDQSKIVNRVCAFVYHCIDLWAAIIKRWINYILRLQWLIDDVRYLPSLYSCTKLITCSFQDPPACTAISTNMWVVARCTYFITMLPAAVSNVTALLSYAVVTALVFRTVTRCKIMACLVTMAFSCHGHKALRLASFHPFINRLISSSLEI